MNTARWRLELDDADADGVAFSRHLLLKRGAPPPDFSIHDVLLSRLLHDDRAANPSPDLREVSKRKRKRHTKKRELPAGGPKEVGAAGEAAEQVEEQEVWQWRLQQHKAFDLLLDLLQQFGPEATLLPLPTHPPKEVKCCADRLRHALKQAAADVAAEAAGRRCGAVLFCAYAAAALAADADQPAAGGRDSEVQAGGTGGAGGRMVGGLLTRCCRVLGGGVGGGGGGGGGSWVQGRDMLLRLTRALLASCGPPSAGAVHRSSAAGAVHVHVQGASLGIAVGQTASQKGKPVGVRVTKIDLDNAEREVIQNVKLGMKLVEVQGQSIGQMTTREEVVAVIKAVVARPLELVFEPPPAGAVPTAAVVELRQRGATAAGRLLVLLVDMVVEGETDMSVGGAALTALYQHYTAECIEPQQKMHFLLSIAPAAECIQEAEERRALWLRLRLLHIVLSDQDQISLCATLAVDKVGPDPLQCDVLWHPLLRWEALMRIIKGGAGRLQQARPAGLYYSTALRLVGCGGGHSDGSNSGQCAALGSQARRNPLPGGSEYAGANWISQTIFAAKMLRDMLVRLAPAPAPAAAAAGRMMHGTMGHRASSESLGVIDLTDCSAAPALVAATYSPTHCPETGRTFTKAERSIANKAKYAAERAAQAKSSKPKRKAKGKAKKARSAGRGSAGREGGRVDEAVDLSCLSDADDAPPPPRLPQPAHPIRRPVSAGTDNASAIDLLSSSDDDTEGDDFSQLTSTQAAAGLKKEPVGQDTRQGRPHHVKAETSRTSPTIDPARSAMADELLASDSDSGDELLGLQLSTVR